MLDKIWDKKLDKHFGNFWRWGHGRYASCGHAGGLSCLWPIITWAREPLPRTGSATFFKNEIYVMTGSSLSMFWTDMRSINRGMVTKIKNPNGMVARRAKPTVPLNWGSTTESQQDLRVLLVPGQLTYWIPYFNFISKNPQNKELCENLFEFDHFDNSLLHNS